MTIIETGTSSVGETPGVDVAPKGMQSGYNGSTYTVLNTIFPPTLNMGKMTWGCANNSGNFTIATINASFGQSSVLTIQDPGAAAANYTLDTGIVAAGTGSSSPGSLTGVSNTLKIIRAGVTYYVPLYAVNT